MLQAVSFSTDTIPQTQATFSKEDALLETYLQHIHWYDEEIPLNRIEAMLAASCMRYLEGLATLDFVLGLSDAIVTKQESRLTVALHYATEILQELAEKQEQGILQHVKQTKVDDCINDVLELLIKRRFIS